MGNNLIKNDSRVFYTVQASQTTVVSSSDFRNNTLRGVGLSRESSDAYQYPNKEVASRVAAFAEGKLIKHTQTEVITEVTEEIKFEEENKL